MACSQNPALSTAAYSLLCLLICILTAACSSQSQPEFNSNYAPQAVDLSGHWEKNYQLSDDLNSKFQLFIYDVQRPYATSRNNAANQGAPRMGASNESLLGLAQITEDITKVAILNIEQNENSIKIDREDNFALSCDYFKEIYVTVNSSFGSEACGWNGEQLIFQMQLTDGLSIFHQITLGPNGQQLNITTTVSSSAVGSPFTVSSYYQRYSPPEYNYDCIFTLSRNNVCTQNGS